MSGFKQGILRKGFVSLSPRWPGRPSLRGIPLINYSQLFPSQSTAALGIPLRNTRVRGIPACVVQLVHSWCSSCTAGAARVVQLVQLVQLVQHVMLVQLVQLVQLVMLVQLVQLVMLPASCWCSSCSS